MNNTIAITAAPQRYLVRPGAIVMHTGHNTVVHRHVPEEIQATVRCVLLCFLRQLLRQANVIQDTTRFGDAMARLTSNTQTHRHHTTHASTLSQGTPYVIPT
jgi:hypothetical protein